VRSAPRICTFIGFFLCQLFGKIAKEKRSVNPLRLALAAGSAYRCLMDRRLRIGVLVAALCGLAGVVGLVCVLPIWRERPALTYSQGSTIINGVRGRTGQRFPPQSTVTTGDDSTCVVVLGRRVALSLGANTEIELNLGAPQPRVALRSGSVACVLSPSGVSSQGAREALAVRTESCLVEALDGAFYVRVEDEPIGPVCTCSASRDPPVTYVYAR